MKVLCISRKHPPSVGGMQRMNYELIRRLAFSTEATVIKWGHSQIFLPLFLLWALFRSLTLLPKKRKPDVIFLGDALLSPLGFTLKKILRRPVAVSAHGRDLTFRFPLYRTKIGFSLRRLDLVIGVSRYTTELCQGMRVPEKKCVTINNGVDIEECTPSRQDEEATRKWLIERMRLISQSFRPNPPSPCPLPPRGEGNSFNGPNPPSPCPLPPRGEGNSFSGRNPPSPSPSFDKVPSTSLRVFDSTSFPSEGEGKTNGFSATKGRGKIESDRSIIAEDTQSLEHNRPIIITVGRLVKRKGIEQFVRGALPLLIAAHPSVLYIVVGDGKERGSIESAIRELGLSGNVLLAGSIPRNVIRGLMGISNVFVMPNIPVHGDVEGFGLVALEASCAGLPVVGSDLEGIRDAVVAGENGFLLPHDNHQLFAETIATLLKNEGKRREIGERAKKFVALNCTWDKCAGRYLDELKKLCKYRSS